MSALTADNLLRFASSLEGEHLTTAGGNATFTLRALPDRLEVTPDLSRRTRRITRKMIEGMCNAYLDRRSKRPRDYQDGFNASYLLAIIDRFERQSRTA